MGGEATLIAQTDTLLFEPFPTDNSTNWASFPDDGTNTLRINWNEYGKEAAQNLPSNLSFYDLYWGQSN